MRDAPQPSVQGHMHQMAPLSHCLLLQGTGSSHGHLPAWWWRKSGANENECMHVWMCVSNEFYRNRQQLFIPKPKESIPQFIPDMYVYLILCVYLNCFPIIPILSVILWPFHIESNNTKQTALKHSKILIPKSFILFISTICWINTIHYSIDNWEN